MDDSETQGQPAETPQGGALSGGAGDDATVTFGQDFSAQLAALDAGYTYGLLWVAAVAVLVGVAALFIGYTPEQVAHAQEVKEAIDAGDI